MRYFTFRTRRTTSSAGVFSWNRSRSQSSTCPPNWASWMFVCVCGSHATRVAAAK